mmetsp:Transcript_24617/g.40106  ORF Transcript_24617/g.40106 Transcript_24617/m.40106 type:complete len:283 (-) Transcript_24617:301-1149(-)
MAIVDLSTPTDSNPSLRSYREAASHLVRSERRLSRGEAPCPLEPCEPKLKAASSSAKDEPSPACGSPPRFRPITATVTPNTKSTSSRCRSRTPSPPHPSPSTRSGESSKAPRSVSPGGTPSISARAALRRADSLRQVSPPPRLRVSWADALVSSIRTRPRTLRKDVASLFYSRADEKRFRQEAAIAVDDEWCESLEDDSLTSLSNDELEDPATDQQRGLWSPTRERKDYAISKAVVVFGEATMTYDGSHAGGCAVEAALEAERASSFSFDDAAFWNGQLTWS